MGNCAQLLFFLSKKRKVQSVVNYGEKVNNGLKSENQRRVQLALRQGSRFSFTEKKILKSKCQQTEDATKVKAIMNKIYIITEFTVTIRCY